MRRINIRLPDEWRAFDRLAFILVIIFAIVLLVLWLLNRDVLLFNCCQEESDPVVAEYVAEPEPEADTVPPPAPVAAPTQPTQPTQLGISIADGVVLLTGVVDSEESRAAIVDQVKQALPKAKINDQLSISTDVVPAADLGSLSEVLSPLSADDRLSMSWSPRSLRVSGTVESDERKRQILDLVQSSAFTQSLYDKVDVVDQLQVAPRGPSCAEILQAAQIEFASGSAVLTDSGKIELSKLLPCLQAPRYQVIGHTDSDGAKSLNEKLSLARAQSAIDFLVSRGEPTSKFYAGGLGETQPIASNATREGKAKNRRIEFRVFE